MKYFALIAAVLALAAATNPGISSWNLHELAAAIENPNTDPALLPYLEDALNEMMESAFSGQVPSPVIISLPVQETWTMEEITEQLHDPNTSPALVPYLENALNELMIAMISGHDVATVTVDIPAMNVNMWTLHELSAAIMNPNVDPELAIYLEHALNQMMTSIWSGEDITSIAVITPPGVPVVAPEVVNPAPVVPVLPPLPVYPVVIQPIRPEEPVPPTVVVQPVQPVQPVPAISAPLVQIILNVNP